MGTTGGARWVLWTCLPCQWLVRRLDTLNIATQEPSVFRESCQGPVLQVAQEGRRAPCTPWPFVDFCYQQVRPRQYAQGLTLRASVQSFFRWSKCSITNLIHHVVNVDEPPSSRQCFSSQAMWRYGATTDSAACFSSLLCCGRSCNRRILRFEITNKGSALQGSHHLD